MKSAAEWGEESLQRQYDYAMPWERFAINFWRWRDGKTLLHPTPRHRRA